MAKTNNASKTKKVVIAGAGEPPPSLGRLIAEQLATQQANAPADFREEGNNQVSQPDAIPMDGRLLDRQVFGPMLSPYPEQLAQAPARYFISATFTFFEGGYQEIAVSGVRTLNDDDLGRIEERMEDLFQAQITAALKKFKASWMGLPDDSRLVINTINRL